MKEIFNGMIEVNASGIVTIKPEFQFPYNPDGIDYNKSKMKFDEIFKECINNNHSILKYHASGDDSNFLAVDIKINNKYTIIIYSLAEYFNDLCAAVISNKESLSDGFVRSVIKDFIKIQKYYYVFSSFSVEDRLQLELLSSEFRR